MGFHEVKALETPVELNSVTVHMIREAAAANPEQPAEKKIKSLNCNIKSDSHTEKASKINSGLFYSENLCFLMRLPNKTDIIKKLLLKRGIIWRGSVLQTTGSLRHWM